MTAGNNGAETPQNDDPFAYLYRSEGGDGDAAENPASASRTGGYGGPGGQPGVPRTSYNQVSRVGERRYGQQANSHYAAPETLPGGAPRQPAPPFHGGHGGGHGPNSKGLLIGAIAVVAVVIMGILAAMLTNSDGDDKQYESKNSTKPTAPAENDEPSDEPTEKQPKAELPKADAASLRIEGPAATASDIKGAESSSGAYVGMNALTAAVTWDMDLEKKGQYTLYVSYSVPGKDQNLTLTVNGEPQTRPLNMENFARAAAGDWEKGWTRTYAIVNLTKGTNTIRVSCETGNQCEVVLDQVWLTKG